MRIRRRDATVCATGALAIGAVLAAQAAGIRVNASPSMPVGIWLVQTSKTVKRGDIVVVCLPDVATTHEAVVRGYVATGTCAGGTEPLVKPVAAIAGDEVAVSAGGVTVNGIAVLNTGALSQDEAGRPLPRVPIGGYHVSAGEVWLLSGHDPRSFDSRYLGAVPTANVQGVAHPLWVLP